MAIITVTNGESITFDTSGATPSFSGTYSGNGELATSQGGSVILAMFTFKSLTIEAGAAVNVTGDRGLVLASRNDMTIGSGVAFDLNGVDATGRPGAAGGPGGHVGGTGGTVTSGTDGSGPGGGKHYTGIGRKANAGREYVHFLS